MTSEHENPHGLRILYGLCAIGVVICTGIALNGLYWMAILGAPEGSSGTLIPLKILAPASVLAWPVVYGLGLFLEQMVEGLDGWAT